MRKRHIFTQTTHAARFIAADGMDDGSCAKEEQGFEHGMCEKVEHRSHIAESLMASHTRDSERNHHETDLRDGRKSQYPFDIGLYAGYYGCIQRSKSPDITDADQHIRGCTDVYREQTGHEKNAGNHHRCCMNQSRYRGRTFHRVR